MKEIRWTSRAMKQLEKIDTRYKDRVLKAVDALADFPNVALDLIRLKGATNKFRMRVEFYRVLFEWIDGEPQIIEIQAVRKRDEQTYH